MVHMILVDSLIKSLENYEYVSEVFLDSPKAFHTLDHSTSLYK